MKTVCHISILLLSAILWGCVSSHEVFVPQASVETLTTIGSEVGKTKKVSLGEVMYLDGDVGTSHGLQLMNAIKASIPGAAGLPFTFNIQPCILMPEFVTRNYTYYAAPQTKATATHTLLGTVVKPGDTIGVRVLNQNSGMEWYVDNSIYNSSRPRSIIWSRPVRHSDSVSFKPRMDLTKAIQGTASRYREVTYSGFINNAYQISFREVNESRDYEKDFLIPKSNEGVTIVSIKGAIIEILSHDNLGVTFTVRKGFKN
jgi:hypothetical protein